jgi:biopolymer transport protein ExbB/TolQ
MSNPLYTAVFNVASVLEIPVIVAALAALAVVIVEIGRFVVEVRSRQRRRPGLARTAALEQAALAAREALRAGEPDRATRLLGDVAWSAAMDETYAALTAHALGYNAENRVAKDLADFDLGTQRRLARTRLLVRIGPALGLMGTLIPLTPALDGLAKGDVHALTENLRVAFSVTVLGLLVGAVAFALSLVRDSMYSQDYSDLEYVASVLTSNTEISA